MDRKFTTPQQVAEDFWYTNDIKLYLPKEDKREEYDAEPVIWCGVCKSLNIVRCDTPLNKELECYCADCGSIDMNEGSIHEWLGIENKINSK